MNLRETLNSLLLTLTFTLLTSCGGSAVFERNAITASEDALEAGLDPLNDPVTPTVVPTSPPVITPTPTPVITPTPTPVITPTPTPVITPTPTPTPTPPPVPTYCGYHVIQSHGTHTYVSPQAGSDYIAFPANGGAISNTTKFALVYNNKYIVSSIYDKAHASYPDGFNVTYSFQEFDYTAMDNNTYQGNRFTVKAPTSNTWINSYAYNYFQSVTLNLVSVVNECRTTQPLSNVTGGTIF